MRALRGTLAVLILAGCRASDPPPPPPPAPAPAPAAAPAPAPVAAGSAADAGPKKSKLVPTPNDGLSLMERVAKRKAAEAKLAAELAAEENNRLLAYDKKKLPQHTSLLAFARKARKQLDDAAAKAKGKPGAAAAIGKVQAGQSKALTAQGKLLAAVDPRGGNSMVVNDHGVILESLGETYPAALISSLGGDQAPLDEQRAELDRRTQKIEAWLAEVKAAKPAGKGKRGKK